MKPVFEEELEGEILRIFVIVALVVIGIAALPIAILYLAPARVVRFVIRGERRRAGLERKQIDLPDGLRYVYLEGGQGEPLLLLHGFGANKDHFSRVARALTARYRVIIPDHIGFGESSHPPHADYSPLAQVERLHAFMQALGIERCHVGGSSMGGHIALTYAAIHPSQVASLWLLDAAGAWSAPESELLRVRRETGRNLLLASTPAEFAGVIAFVTAKPPFIPKPLLKALAQERIGNYELEKRIADQLLADSVEARIADLAIPALIVWGEEDRAIHVGSATVLQQLLPRSQVIILPRVGHLPAVEAPRQTANDYLRFRDSL